MLQHLRTSAAAIAIAIAPGTILPLPVSAETRLPDGVDAGTGLRMERYRAPVPDFIPGGSVATLDEMRRLIAGGRALFIDVYPPEGAGPDPLDGTWRNTETRENIAGSVWLPNVGRGYLEPDLEAYFRRNIERLSSGDKARPLVFYCTADCWQSWNAARRAILWGYAAVYWYPEGTDGWTEAGGRIVPAEPVNFLEDE